ncbi:ABC transporter ATP-binding protein [Aliiruegeria sabulilitoris]|uniref:ABC transporter ATP-binding protein n=1 Tax=Aliiruegeria sabulilitoris TaxID=1510458 RepID=UPI0008318667|nr:ABC transporter ATP-binding protein [Aliiruegeria sabulilitoris]NDR58888.1 ABC transporter ATP-binding protein [Pseudoruegeria sp. M32A2M]
MTEPILSTHELTRRFGALVANETVSIDLRPGEVHALIGPNGAGKSTLVGQICGAITPDAGRVRFLGRDVTEQSTRTRARAGLARTFQISALAMEDSVFQNAVLGAMGAAGNVWRFLRPAMKDMTAREKAEQALERVGLSDLAALRTGEISHGQRRRLEVAVALTLAPKAFVMDEPMAGLGAEGTRELTGLLDELRQEAPILLVEHDMDVVFALADRITVLNYGRVIATGSTAEIRRDPEVRRAYLGEES